MNMQMWAIHEEQRLGVNALVQKESHIWRSPEGITHMKESRHTYEGGMSHIWRRHAARMHESSHSYEWVMSHIWMRRCGLSLKTTTWHRWNHSSTRLPTWCMPVQVTAEGMHIDIYVNIYIYTRMYVHIHVHIIYTHGRGSQRGACLLKWRQ